MLFGPNLKETACKVVLGIIEDPTKKLIPFTIKIWTEYEGYTLAEMFLTIRKTVRAPITQFSRVIERMGYERHHLAEFPDLRAYLVSESIRMYFRGKFTHNDIWELFNFLGSLMNRPDYIEDEKDVVLRVIIRTRIIKEELMQAAWSPKRLEAWLEAGYDPDD